MATGAQIDFLLTPFVNSAGDPLVGGTVEFYIAGTSTPVTVYAEKELTTPLGTFVTLDSLGVALAFCDTDNFLKIIVKDASAATLKTYDGLGFSLGGPLASDAYLRDGSLSLTGEMDADTNNITNVGDIEIGTGKSLDVNHGHSYSNTAADMVTYGDSTGYVRNYVSSAIGRMFFNTVELWNVTATSVKAMLGLDLNSQKLTSVGDGTLDTDGINKGQLDVVGDQVVINTADILTNTGDISTNAGNISTNTGNISTNTTNIGTNTGNISTNTTNIGTNTAGVAANALLPYSLNRLSIYAATVATGDGSGKDTSNKISYLNLFKEDGLLTSAGNYDVFTTENTVTIGQEVSIQSGGIVEIKSTAAIAFTDAVNIVRTAVFFRTETIGSSTSYDVTFNDGFQLSTYSVVDCRSDLDVNGVYSSNYSVQQRFFSYLSIGGNLAVQNDHVMSQADYLGVGGTLSTDDFECADHGTVEVTGAFTCSALTLHINSVVKAANTITASSGDIFLNRNASMSCSGAVTATSGAIGAYNNSNMAIGSLSASAGTSVFTNGSILTLTGNADFGSSQVNFLEQCRIDVPGTMDCGELHIHGASLHVNGNLSCGTVDAVTHGSIDCGATIAVTGNLIATATSYISGATLTVSGSNSVNASQMSWTSTIT